MANAEVTIRLAYRDAGILAEGVVPNSQQYTEGLERLNIVISELQTENSAKIWLESVVPVPLTAGTRSYSIGPALLVNMARPLRVLGASYLDAQGNRRPLDLPSRLKYFSDLSDISSEGSINSVYVEKLYDRINLFLWMVPDTTAATGSLEVLVQQFLAGPININLDTRFGPEWSLALHWALADDLTTGQPQAIIDRCARRRIEFVEKALMFDTDEEGLTIMPDSQSYVPSRFL